VFIWNARREAVITGKLLVDAVMVQVFGQTGVTAQ
jgi:hypothetical protein